MEYISYKYRIVCVSIVAIFLFLEGVAASGHANIDIPTISVQVLDLNDKPLSGIMVKARLVILERDNSVKQSVGGWAIIGSTLNNGRIDLQSRLIHSFSNKKTGMFRDKILGYEVFFAGKNIAPTLVRTPTGQFPKSVKIETGVEVVIKLEGDTTKGEPKIVSADNTFYAISKRSQHFIDLKKIEKNTWKCRLKKGDHYVIGWLSRKLYGYQSEPFTASENLQVAFSPGMPAIFEYNLTNPPEDIQVLPVNLSLLIKTSNNTKTSYLSWGEVKKIKKPGIVRINGLAAGMYKISACTFVPNQIPDTPYVDDRREIEIQAGITNRFEPIYPLIDRSVEKGDVVIHGIVYDSNKNPMPNKAVKLTLVDNNGRMFNLYYTPSVTDKNGRFEFTGVRPNLAGYIKCDGAMAFIGKESLSKEACITINLNVGPKRLIQTSVGSPIDDISIRWKDGSNGKLIDFRGKVIVVDFWASWCLPCRRALPKLNVLAKENSWKEDIVFIALSTDYDRAIWEKTIAQCNWSALRQGWFDRENNSFVFNKAIPYCMVIDKNGIIRSAGNDIDVKLELYKIEGEFR